MNRRAPTAEAARAKLEWPWAWIGLAVFALLYRLALPISAPLPSSTTTAEHGAHEREKLSPSERAFETPPPETGDEDPAPDVEAIVSRVGFEPTSYRLVVRDHLVSIQKRHFLISTGLGRGPPIG